MAWNFTFMPGLTADLLRAETIASEDGLAGGQYEGWSVILTRPGHKLDDGGETDSWCFSGKRLDGKPPLPQQIAILQRFAIALGASQPEDELEENSKKRYWAWVEGQKSWYWSWVEDPPLPLGMNDA